MAAAVRDIVDEDGVHLGYVDGFPEREGGGVFNKAARVARGKLEIGNDGVARIDGIEFTISMARQSFISANCAERAAIVGGRLHIVYDDARDSGVEGEGE